MAKTSIPMLGKFIKEYIAKIEIDKEAGECSAGLVLVTGADEQLYLATAIFDEKDTIVRIAEKKTLIEFIDQIVKLAEKL